VPETQNIIPCLRRAGLELGLEFSNNVLDTLESENTVIDSDDRRKPAQYRTRFARLG
jgi:hypothetical protein